MLDVLNSKKERACGSRPGEQGFSMLELVVAMVIFLVVTGSIFGVLQVAQRSRSTVNMEVQMTKSVRLGLNLVGRDTYNAGYGYPLKNSVVIRNAANFHAVGNSERFGRDPRHGASDHRRK